MKFKNLKFLKPIRDFLINKLKKNEAFDVSIFLIIIRNHIDCY